MKIVKSKLKEITPEEYGDIISITRMMLCLKEGEDMTLQYLGLEDTPANRKVAYNVLMAVKENYKYFKIIKK